MDDEGIEKRRNRWRSKTRVLRDLGDTFTTFRFLFLSVFWECVFCSSLISVDSMAAKLENEIRTVGSTPV